MPAVRDRVAPRRRFGIGLRLSARAARELAAAARRWPSCSVPGARAPVRVHLNGFPYGAFHGTRVKEDVYLPDWRDAERLRYTDQLADLLAELLPPATGVDGSISTVPGAFQPARRGRGRRRARWPSTWCATWRTGARSSARTGKIIALALEPEPFCFLETIAEAVRSSRSICSARPRRAARR